MIAIVLSIILPACGHAQPKPKTIPFVYETTSIVEVSKIRTTADLPGEVILMGKTDGKTKVANKSTGHSDVDVSRVYGRTGKEVVHLTYGRVPREELGKHWDLQPLTQDLMNALIKFANGADPEKLHGDVIRTLEYWNAKITYHPTQESISSHATVGSSSIQGATFPPNPVKK